MTDTSSDVLRKAGRCTKCGCRGATLMMPGAEQPRRGLRRNEVRRATSLAPEHLQGRALAKTSEHVPEFHDLPTTWTRARIGALCELRFAQRRRQHTAPPLERVRHPQRAGHYYVDV